MAFIARVCHAGNAPGSGDHRQIGPRREVRC